MDKKVIRTEHAPGAVGPYSQAIVTGNLVFTAGQIPLVPETGQIIEGGIEAQTRQVLDNLKAVLEAAGSSLNNIIKTTVFLQSMNDFAAMNGIYAEYFTEPYPARSTVEVAKLPRGALVEIETIAVID